MLKAHNKKGFTLAETLMVVAIIVILAAVAFIAIINYLRTMTKLQYDGYAKEIFIAAQNHLAVAHREGYPARKNFGISDGSDAGADDEGIYDEGIYYYVVNARDYEHSSSVNDATSVLGEMLPFASLDDTVRLGGSYIIRYHLDSGTVLDVFYWSENEGRYPHHYKEEDYSAFMVNRSNRDALRSYGADRSVIGYYGGEEAENLPRGTDLKAPDIRVINAEMLYVVVTDPNVDTKDDYKLTLIIEGESGAPISVELNGTTDGDTLVYDSAHRQYCFLLDDISAEEHRFANMFPELIPGENLRLRVVASYENALADVVYSATATANSLFGNGTKDGKAEIANIRHLENLDVENLDGDSGLSSPITSAWQTSDLSWPNYKNAIQTHAYWPNVETPVYHPVALKNDFEAYDGGRFRITGTDPRVSDGDAGVFGELNGVEVKDLMLVDCTAEGADAGALAGSANGATVTNVLAIHSAGNEGKGIKGTKTAGGLIGSVTGVSVTGVSSGSITNCAAALVVESDGIAGGLIGETNSVTVTGCYSGGHTNRGAYYEHSVGKLDVTGATAGGLIGAAHSANVSNSYSTCSVSGTATAGGLVGTAGGVLSNCYATGLVRGSVRGAFAGSYTGSDVTGCYYYKTVNEAPKDGDAKNGFTYLEPFGNGAGNVAAFDDTDGSRPGAEVFSSFVGAGRAAAAPYDTALRGYYRNKYPLKTYADLTGSDFVATHYGDWPAPETWVINE
jgi:prepilin-type N-terminal cleavage/methylation domain-containing protein